MVPPIRPAETGTNVFEPAAGAGGGGFDPAKLEQMRAPREFELSGVGGSAENALPNAAPETGRANEHSADHSSSTQREQDESDAGESNYSDKAMQWVIADRKTSYWTLAQQYYGNGNLFRELHAFNFEQFGLREIAPGARVAIPPRRQLESPGTSEQITANGAVAGSGEQDGGARYRIYTTVRGETLFSIAAERLGQAARYTEIWELNRGALPEGVTQQTRLPSGIRIRLPTPQ